MKTKYFIFLILLLAFFLRVWKIDSVPPHLTPDEAALGYNAYSILKTGRDEHGEFFPLIFKSFGDYKPGLYVYLAVPFVAIFGLSETTVRLPSALSGVIGVYLVYAIGRLLFEKKRLSIIASFLFAISPWAIYFSRGAWEANAALTLTLLGVYFFLLSLEKHKKYLPLSALLFGLTLLSYQGAKLSTSIVVFLLLTLFYKKVISFGPKILSIAFLVGILTVIPVVSSVLQGRAGRLAVFSIFSYHRPDEYLKNILDQTGEERNSLTYGLFHSEPYDYLRGILTRYFNHFSGRFLFFEGDFQNPRHSSPNQGMLLFADIALLIAGAFVVSRKIKNKEMLFVVLWLFLSPLPAALSRDQVHAVRSLNMVVPLTLILALGLDLILSDVKRYWRIALIPFCALYIVNYLYFLDSYFVHLPKHNSTYWQYGYKQMVEEISSAQSNYSKIKVQQSYAQPYIYFLFFQKYDPAAYQKQTKVVDSKFGDVGLVEKIGNIEFAAIDWSAESRVKGNLLVGDSVVIPDEAIKDEKNNKLIKEIKFLDGKTTAFRILEVKK